ncbi:MAG TPA: hypothetical protein VMZ50_12170, partial [Phycisphaerae bacterium]|nr:hypothetical protein [Phycisphaerae bacterium]
MKTTGVYLCCMAILTGCPRPAAPPPTGASMVTSVATESWETPYGMGRKIKTKRYQVFTTVSEKRLSRYLPGFLEAAHDNYLRLTGLEGQADREPLTVYMLADRQQWDALTRHRFHRSLPIEAGGYCVEGVCVFWDIGILPSLSVAAHEGFHQFFHVRLKDRLPMWLEEGLCVTAEGYFAEDQSVTFTPDRNVSRFNDLRATMVGQRWRALKNL